VDTSEQKNRSWVWYSTDASREAGQISVLAVVETLACVVAFWVLLLWFDVRWHLWLILLATPFVLLRSKQSVALGAKWFESYEAALVPSQRSWKSVCILLLSAVIAGLTSWWLARDWIIGRSSFVLLGAPWILYFGVLTAVALSTAFAGWVAQGILVQRSNWLAPKEGYVHVIIFAQSMVLVKTITRMISEVPIDEDIARSWGGMQILHVFIVSLALIAVLSVGAERCVSSERLGRLTGVLGWVMFTLGGVVFSFLLVMMILLIQLVIGLLVFFSKMGVFTISLIGALMAAATVALLLYMGSKSRPIEKNLASELFEALSSPGVVIGVLVRIIAIRTIATARFLFLGLDQLPRNWRFATAISDLSEPLQLVPGVESTMFRMRFFALNQQGAPLWHGQLSHIIIQVMGLIVFVPTLLWRLAIKSTAWFYLPLLWFRRGWQKLDGEELTIWAKSYSSKFQNWIWLITGGMSFAFLAATLFSVPKWIVLQQRLGEFGAPTTVLGFLYALDWSDLLDKPWLWCYIISYCLTFAIFCQLDSIAKDIRSGAKPQTRALRMKLWMWMSNIRSFLTNAGIFIALWYFLDAVEAWSQIREIFARLI